MDPEQRFNPGEKMDQTVLLSAMKRMEEISSSLETTSWVWGGLTMDIYQGRLLRPHHDLDYITLNLSSLFDLFSRSLRNIGWQVQKLSTGDLQADHQGFTIRLGQLVLSTEACWSHNGDRGSLFFPRDWLGMQAKPFYGFDVHVVAPELQYLLLDHPELLNPEWVARRKDITARSYFLKLLREDGVRFGDLQARIRAEASRPELPLPGMDS